MGVVKWYQMTKREFGQASTLEEFEQLHRLNHRTFAEEIPQHPPRPDGRLVDRFHDENTYLVCRDGGRIIGMVAVRARRPFSLDGKLESLESYLPPHRAPVEVRLLAVEKEWRGTAVFVGLLRLLGRHALAQGYDLAVMSGTVRQSQLYRHLGFVPFGPLVGAPEARFQPMYLTRAAFDALPERFRI